MESEKLKRIERAKDNLSKALAAYQKRAKGDDLPFLTVCKTLEVLFEYAWKEFKIQVEKEGLFAASPKEAIKQAAAIGLVDDVERWLLIVAARNDSVHDYFGIPQEKYIEFANDFIFLVDSIDWK